MYLCNNIGMIKYEYKRYGKWYDWEFTEKQIVEFLEKREMVKIKLKKDLEI